MITITTTAKTTITTNAKTTITTNVAKTKTSVAKKKKKKRGHSTQVRVTHTWDAHTAGVRAIALASGAVKHENW